MYWSKYFIPTMKEVPSGTEAISHQLSLRAGLVNMLTSGVYSYLPLGLRVLTRIENIIREEMDRAGANEVLLPSLHPIEIWKQTGRDQTLKEVMYSFDDKRGRKLCLGPTHEEIITDIARQFVQSYKQLPVVLYQIQTKFRDELRTRFGIVRACEFIMKDAYSFDRDKEGLLENYQFMYEAYNNIFKRLELPTVILEADSGAMGGDISHEFMVPAPIGEDSVYLCGGCGFAATKRDDQNEKICPACNKEKLTKQVAIELGHIFQLGTKYSQAQQAVFIDDDGKQKPIIMGCYGIGVSRVIAAIIEKHNDDKGISWPREVAPFDVEILPIAASKSDRDIYDVAEDAYRSLGQNGFEVLMDDRDESAGRKFNDADLIGIPIRLTIGKRNLAEGKVEVKLRKTNEVHLIHKNDILETVKKISKQ